MGTHRLRILHISDLHMTSRAVTGDWRRDRVLGEELDKSLEPLRADRPDLVCVTGDIAQSGAPEEYKQATVFIDHLLEVIDVPKDRLFVVPGNHDIARMKGVTAWEKLRSLGGNDDVVHLSRLMAGGQPPRDIDPALRDQILSRQSAYREWVATGLGRPDLLPDAGRPHPCLGYRATLPGKPFEVHVIGLDTAWLAGDDNDAEKLRLTSDQIGSLTHRLGGFRLALAHHPLSSLADGNEARDLLARNVSLLLHGHVHETRLLLVRDPDQALLEIAAGCLFVDDRYPNGYHCVDVTLDDRGAPQKLDVAFWSWSKIGFWHADSSIYRNAPGGRISIDFP